MRTAGSSELSRQVVKAGSGEYVNCGCRLLPLGATLPALVWDDVKARCLAYLKSSDPKKLAEMMMRARVMASLAGRAAVLERV